MNEDTKLVQACRSGDVRAFEVIVSRYQALVCAITYSAVGQRDISEELAQETFIQAWRKLDQLKEPGKFRSWLCSIARSIVCNHIRAQKRSPVVYGEIEDLPADKREHPEEQFVRQEEEEMIRTALMQLPEEYREPLVLFYRQEQSTRQVAEMMGLEETTVRTRLHRGRQMLREQVEAKIETTLRKTAPGVAFTRSVMGAVGVGLAAGIAGSATAAGAAAAGGSAGLTAAGGVLTAATLKIAAVAAAIVITAGVTVYSVTRPANRQENATTNNTTAALIQQQQQQQQQTQDKQHPQADAAPIQADATPVQTISNPAPLTETPAPTPAPAKPTTPAVRHPDWPGLNEPVQNYYMTLIALEVAVPGDDAVDQMDPGPADQKLWIRLPRQFREENSKTILIDNGKERIEVDKTKKTVRRSSSLAVGEDTVYKDGISLRENEIVVMTGLFRRLQTLTSEPNERSKYTVIPTGTQDGGSVLVYKVVETGSESAQTYDCKAYVDAATLLPEKLVVAYWDEDKSEYNPGGEYLFDFAPISDSIFSYSAKPDETQLPPKEQPGFRGYVVDIENNPVAGAEVFVNYFPLWGLDYLQGVTDNAGYFEIKIPDKSPHHNSIVHLPINYWAVLPDNPDFFAWTILPFELKPGEHEKDFIPGFGGNVLSEREMQDVHSVTNGISTVYQVPSSTLKEPVIEDVLLVMQSTSIILGIVTDLNGVPISEAEITVGFQVWDPNTSYMLFDSSSLKLQYSARSNQQGYYEVIGLPPLWELCRYKIHISSQGFVSEFKEIVIDEPRMVNEFNINLHSRRVTVSGVLKDNYGTPLEKRSIDVSVPNMSVDGCSAITDPNGYFVIPGCPDIAGIELHASLSWHNPFMVQINNNLIEKEKYLSYQYYPDVYAVIPYTAGQKEYHVEMTAVHPEQEVEITVIDSEGYPVPELKVEIDGFLEGDWDHPIPQPWRIDKLQKRTDVKGSVKFDNIPELKTMNVVLLPKIPFSAEDHMLAINDKERQQLQKLDRDYADVYHTMKLPVLLVPGQKQYKMTITILTHEEYERQESDHNPPQ